MYDNYLAVWKAYVTVNMIHFQPATNFLVIM